MENKIEYWNEFWKNYRAKPVEDEADLFIQVGKTVNKQPITQAALEESVHRICNNLELNKKDDLVEFCCGNGLVSIILANEVNSILASDFSDIFIENAKRFKAKENITYYTRSAMEPFEDVLEKGKEYNKFLMNDALAYFEVNDLRKILNNIQKVSDDFLFYITGAPCDELKWNFYNTDERAARYKDNLSKGEFHNDGMGRWWKKDELISLANELGLEVKIENQPDVLSNYRMDILFKKK